MPTYLPYFFQSVSGNTGIFLDLINSLTAVSRTRINGNNDVLRIKLCILNVDGNSMKYALHSSSLIR